ncbi:MAG: acetylxylan esterase [Eubacteriales bacterium]|nr:acetylxylan esterase [Eubacteriales bacterium]
MDLPLNELKKYMGKSPCPSDFDEYWDEALSEMKMTDPDVKLLPATFQAPGVECFHLYFAGVGGARVHAKYYRPKSNGLHPALLTFHGYHASSGDWFGNLAYAQAGFCVASMDVRGQGGLSEDNLVVNGGTDYGHVTRGLSDGAKKLFYRNVFLDAAMLARIIMDFEEVDAERVGAYGGSQGGALTVVCAALEPRIKRIAPRAVFLSDYQRYYEMHAEVCGLTSYFRNFDVEHLHEQEIFNTLGYIDIQNLAPRVKAECLFSVGLADTTCPPSTQFATYNKINSKKSIRIYPDFAHETPTGFIDESFLFLAKLL